MLSFQTPEFIVERDNTKCTNCMLCIKQCSFGVHVFDPKHGTIKSDNMKCVNCHRCVIVCPQNAITIVKNRLEYRENPNWTSYSIRDIQKQAETGGILLTGMGSPTNTPIYFDKIVINASQVTNPSIDPLREPMELTTYLGRKPSKLEFDSLGRLKTKLYPQLKLRLPIMFSAMSFGSISINACEAIAAAANELGIYSNTGEGGLPDSIYKYGKSVIVQVASGRFGVHPDYLNAGAAVEIKIGQGAKPGIGGHLPGEKVGHLVSKTRMIPEGSDAISPAPHHDIYSIEDLKQLIFALKEATNYQKPIIVKIAAVNNAAAIASGIVRAGADIIAVDGYRGGTGAAPTRMRDHVGIPIETAVASIDKKLRDEGIRNSVSIIAGGSLRSSADIIKIIALGADAVYIASAALIAMGCHMCQHCYTGKCNWGIATQKPELVNRLNVSDAKTRLENLITAWEREIKEMLGGMGINSIESLRGNRYMLRGIGMSSEELDILGILPAGE